MKSPNINNQEVATMREDINRNRGIVCILFALLSDLGSSIAIFIGKCQIVNCLHALISVITRGGTVTDFVNWLTVV